MLEIKNLSYEIEENGQKKSILKDINFSCLNSETIAITGHNGSGKSTLLKIIMGIIKPTCGEIIFEGKNINQLSINERANLGIAYSFQTPVTFKGLTASELFSISNNKADMKAYCDILAKLGVCAREYLPREINKSLSGGEQKRIDIASVLLRNAKLNLFDEPEAGIDIWSFDKLTSIFQQIKGANIIVSHQKKLLEKADKILVLNAGELVMFGTAKEIMPNLKASDFCSRLRSRDGQNN